MCNFARVQVREKPGIGLSPEEEQAFSCSQQKKHQANVSTENKRKKQHLLFVSF
jgi:hypothetical protein